MDFSKEELMEADKALRSTLHKCQAITMDKLPKAQQTLLKRRIRALEIALELIEKEQGA